MPRAVSGVAALLIACNDNAKPPLAPDRDLPVMSIGESELYAYRAAELEHMFDDASRATHVEPVPRTRVITRLARVHARIEGTCGLCVRALPIVEHAIADAVLAGKDDACDAALDFLRVLTRDSGDSQTADSFAQRLIDRFGVRPESAECVTAIRALYAELETRKPGSPRAYGQSLTIAPPRARDVAMSGDEASRFAQAVPERVRLLAIDQFGESSDSGRGEAVPPVESVPLAAASDVAASEVRIVLGFDGPAQFRRGELPAQPDAPRRIVLDFDRAARGDALPESREIAAAGVARVSVAALDPDRMRVEFEVAESTQYRLFFLPRPYRVVLDFTQPRAALPEARSSIRTIVLDPGHGGVHGGARSPNGLSEAEVALNLAVRVRRALLRTLPDPRVILTREDDRFVSLEERTAIANALGADLFVSIHLNASPSPHERGGVSTYVLDATHDAQALGLAARENEAAPADVSTLSTLFGSLVRRDQVARSLELANLVQVSMLRGGRRQLPQLVNRGVKRALFYVLVGARMPAILCEASFLTRPEEAEALQGDPYRQLLADGIAEGIARYVRKVERARPVLAEGANESSP
jgi:N-acetylmuramoyl-L-alanine amidase